MSQNTDDAVLTWACDRRWISGLQQIAVIRKGSTRLLGRKSRWELLRESGPEFLLYSSF